MHVSSQSLNQGNLAQGIAETLNPTELGHQVTGGQAVNNLNIHRETALELDRRTADDEVGPGQAVQPMGMRRNLDLEFDGLGHLPTNPRHQFSHLDLGVYEGQMESFQTMLDDRVVHKAGRKNKTAGADQDNFHGPSCNR